MPPEKKRPQPRRTPGAVGGAQYRQSLGLRRLSVDLDPAVYEDLRIRAAERGQSMAEYLRGRLARIAAGK